METGTASAAKRRRRDEFSLWGKCKSEGPSLWLCRGNFVLTKSSFTTTNAIGCGSSWDSLHPNATRQPRFPKLPSDPLRWQTLLSSTPAAVSSALSVPQFCFLSQCNLWHHFWTWHSFLKSSSHHHNFNFSLFLLISSLLLFF